MSKFLDYLGSTKILVFPEFRQVYRYDCGANAMQAILVYYGFDLREDEVMEIAGTTEEGTSPFGLMRTAEEFSIPYEWKQNMELSDLKDYIDNGSPILISLQAWVEEPDRTVWKETWEQGHYVICIGYDSTRFYFEDPASTKRTSLTYEELDERWHDVDEDGNKYEHHGIVFLGTPKYRYNDVEHMA